MMFPDFKRLRQWAQEYGRGEVSDQRAAEDFVEVEAEESVRALKAELVAIKNGNYDADALQNLIGPNRKVRHGTYAEWARVMLMWIAGYKR